MPMEETTIAEPKYIEFRESDQTQSRFVPSNSKKEQM